mgnify:CR=1 FL=1
MINLLMDQEMNGMNSPFTSLHGLHVHILPEFTFKQVLSHTSNDE